MNDRGWSADSSAVLGHRVVAWLAERTREDPSRIPSNGDVAAALGVDVGDVIEVTALLAAEGLGFARDGMVPSSSSARLTPAGVSLASRWATARASRRERRVAYRDALLERLYEQPGQVPEVGPFLDATRAFFFGDRFTEDEANGALDYLGAVGLAKGAAVAWGGVPAAPGGHARREDLRRAVRQQHWERGCLERLRDRPSPSRIRRASKSPPARSRRAVRPQRSGPDR